MVGPRKHLAWRIRAACAVVLIAGPGSTPVPAEQSILAANVCYEVWTDGNLLGYRTTGRWCQPTWFVVDCIYPSTGLLPYLEVGAEACVPI